MANIHLSHTIDVPASPDEAWAALVDLGRIAPCLPGATLEGVEDGEYSGNVAVKLGPITARYSGVAQFVERDDAGRRAVLAASGSGSQGRASATIVAQLSGSGSQSTLALETDLELSGRVAQFGRSGAMVEVSEQLMATFAENLRRELGATGAAGAGGASLAASGAGPSGAGASGSGAGVGAAPAAAASSVDVLALVGPVLRQRLGPAFVGFLIGVIVALLIGRCGRSRSA